MNSFILDPSVVEQIRERPRTPAQIFEILDGCEHPDRNFDVPTGQSFSNGVSLCYTPKTRLPPTPPKSKKGRGRKRPPPEEEVQQTEGHHGLGVLDILPVSPQIIFTHGSGRDIYQAGFTHFVRGLARTHSVLAFRKDRGEAGSREEELYRRTAAFSYFFNDAYSSVRAMGGRSFGGRSAARASVYSTNTNLILWSYPLIRDSDWRKDELIALSENTRVLFIKGEKDWMAPGLLMDSVRKQMKAKTWTIYVKDMEHNFSCKTELEEEKITNALGVIAGIWLRGDDSLDQEKPTPWDPADGTEMTMHWDAATQQAVWSDWTTSEKNQKEQGFVETSFSVQVQV